MIHTPQSPSEGQVHTPGRLGDLNSRNYRLPTVDVFDPQDAGDRPSHAPEVPKQRPGSVRAAPQERPSCSLATQNLGTHKDPSKYDRFLEQVAQIRSPASGQPGENPPVGHCRSHAERNNKNYPSKETLTDGGFGIESGKSM